VEFNTYKKNSLVVDFALGIVAKILFWWSAWIEIKKDCSVNPAPPFFVFNLYCGGERPSFV